MVAGRTTAPQPIVFRGSSSTAGTAASTNANRYVNRLGTLIQADYPSGLGSESGVASLNTGSGAPYTQAGFHIYNGGIGGSTSNTYASTTVITQTQTVGAKLIVDMIGANDERTNVSPATFQANLQAVINSDKAAMPGVPHLLIASYQPFDGTYTYPHSAYGAAMKAISDADPQNVSFVSVDDAFVNIGIAPNNGKSDIYGFIDTDHIHMLDQGHAFMAETLRARLSLPGSITVVYPDITPPSIPGTPTATASAGSTSVTWAASTDDRAVTGYSVYRSDAPTVALATLGNVTTFADTTGTTGSSYSYTVSARDAAGNASAKSASSNTVTAQAGGDLTPPSTIAKPKVEPIASGVQLTWIQATDNVGVTQNKIYRNGTLLKTISAATTTTDLTTTAGTVYSYTVSALDAAGNESTQSPAGFGMSGTKFDTFNRADGAVGTADDGSAYNTRLSTTLPVVIASLQAKQSQPYTQDTGVTQRRMSSQDVGTGTAAIAFGFHVGAIAAAADASGGFAFNIASTGATFTYLSFRQSSSALGLSIVKVTSAGGTPSVVQAGTTTLAVGDFVSATFSGTTATVLVNGVAAVSSTAVSTKTTSEVGPYFSGAFNGGIDDWVAA